MGGWELGFTGMDAFRFHAGKDSRNSKLWLCVLGVEDGREGGEEGFYGNMR